MKTVLTGILLLWTLAVVQPGLCADGGKYKAQMEGIDRVHDACIDKADGVTSEMRDCQGQAHQAMDGLLNETYKALRNGIKDDKTYAEALKKEQIAWIKLRDEAVRSSLENAGGGSMSPLVANGVALEMMRNRIALFIYLLPE